MGLTVDGRSNPPDPHLETLITRCRRRAAVRRHPASMKSRSIHNEGHRRICHAPPAHEVWAENGAAGENSSSATTCCRVALLQGRPRSYPAAMIGGEALPLFLGFRAMLWPGPTWHASPPVCALEPASCIRQYRLEFAWAVIRRTARGGGRRQRPARPRRRALHISDDNIAFRSLVEPR